MYPPLLRVHDLSVTFNETRLPQGAPGLIPALAIEQWQLSPGAQVGIRGPSGSGKSTLLNVLSGLLVPQRGSVVWQGTDITQLGEGDRDRWRRNNIGFIFQNFHLIPELSALENVLQTVRFDHWRCPPVLHHRACELLHHVGVPRLHQLAGQLSRGQQQRVAVARALLKSPGILLADEPTASLDRANADAVIELLLGVAQVPATHLIVVSHDERLLKQLKTVYELVEGRLKADL